VLLQAVLFFTAQPETAHDSASYMAQAESLAATGAARNALGEPDTLRTPGYPLFLAAFLFSGLGYAGAVASQRILWLLVVAATTWLSWRLTRRPIVAVVAGLITAIDVPAMQATNSILTETLAAVFVCAAAWQAYRSASDGVMSRAAMAGLLAGAAALIRPVAILFGVTLAIAIAFASPRGNRARLAATVVTISLAICGSWMARNYLQTGVVTFSSISSVNLLLYRAAGTLAIRDPGGVDANIGRRQAELEAAACAVAAARFGRDCASLPIARRATVYGELAWPIILGDPIATVMQAGRAFVMIMFGGGANMIADLTGMPESRARLLATGYTVPLAVLAAMGLVFWWRVDRLALSLLLLTIAYLVVMSLGVEAYSRFRVPFLPLYAMLAGGGAAALADRLRRG
jgi:hypothetical protein